MSADERRDRSEPSSPATAAVVAPLRGADWQVLFSLEKQRDADDRAVFEKALRAFAAAAGARRAALFALTEGGLQPIANVGEVACLHQRGARRPRPARPAGRRPLPRRARARPIGDDPGLLLLAAGVRICRLKQQLVEHRFQANLRGVELQALYEVGLAIASTLDIERLGEEVLLRAVSLLDARRAALYLAENGVYRLLGQFGGDDARATIPGTEVDVLGLMADRAAPPENLLPGVRHLLAVPVEIDGSPRGLLAVGDKESRTGIGPFGAKDRRMALLFANQAALALENAKLHKLALEKERMEGEMELASEIQKQILPKSTPQPEGFELAGWYRPARHVGGDYYSFLDLGNNRLGLVVADVTGKGMPAGPPGVDRALRRPPAARPRRPRPRVRGAAQQTHLRVEQVEQIHHLPLRLAGLRTRPALLDQRRPQSGPAGPPRRQRGAAPSSGLPLGLMPFATYRAATRRPPARRPGLPLQRRHHRM